MNGIEFCQKIHDRWPQLNRPTIPADLIYADGIDDELVHKFWKRWKYGFLGFGGAPLYVEEGQDCDDLVRGFIVKFRHKYCVKGEAKPIFYTGWNGHAYCSYINQDGHVVSIDLRDGKLYQIESFIVEMA